MSLKLHIGCGPIRMAGWTNIDQNESPATDIVMDCCDIVGQFGPDSADAIYSCHMLEHLSYPDKVLAFLVACRTVLKSNGVLRIAVPDLGIAARAYAAGNDMKFIYGESHHGFYYKDCAAERFLYFMREWQHTVVFDYDLLRSLLFDAGFDNGLARFFNCSLIPGFSHDRFESESIYVESVKA